jgi:LysR family glycine cleavage system transcriptional activator
MTKPLRSLAGLIDFECAARWGSFKLAAQELHKTPAAISLQIKQLEQALGFELFVRHPRHITLSEKGEDLAVTVRRTLTELQAKVTALQESDEEKVLRISTTYSMALKWLVPRIGNFTKRYPEIDIRIESSDKLANLEDGSTDIALRVVETAPNDPETLFEGMLVPIYSPALIPPGRTELTLEDLSSYPLLYEYPPDAWTRLLRANGVTKGNFDFSRSYSNFAVLVQAALAGQGIGLVSHFLAYDDIQRGALKMMACQPVRYRRSYRMLVGRGKEGMSKIARFRSWLDEEIAEMQRALD